MKSFDYEAKYARFINQFNELDEDFVPQYKYLKMLQMVVDKARSVVCIDLDDLSAMEGESLVKDITRNTASHIRYLYNTIDNLLFNMAPSVPVNLDFANADEMLKIHRINEAKERNALESIPKAILRSYELVLKPPSAYPRTKLRDLRALQIGHLVSVTGVVTRISEVKPNVMWATYTCDQCGSDIYQEIMATEFMPLDICTDTQCGSRPAAAPRDAMAPGAAGGNPDLPSKRTQKGRLILQTRGSKFERFQELRVQESPSQVPAGSTPRTVTVSARGSATRKCMPGLMVSITGIYLPRHETGFKAIKAGLISSTYLEALSITPIDRTGAAASNATNTSASAGIHQSAANISEDLENLSQTLPSVEQQRVQEKLISMNRMQLISKSPDPLAFLAKAMAPEIYGMLNVKKALLLLLVGGMAKVASDGLRVRGDINICLVGDPGVAKSQLLKYTVNLARRGIYTTGKGSSGVGLTASVSRDPITNEFALEGGALVLADNGVCAIDEFDKMDENDRTAIYEAMEQQTISIAKAGITTTLNARASILAAANPVYGRYNESKTIEENINLSAALLSRFDLVFLLLDKADAELDIKLAHHVTYVHQHNKAPELPSTASSSSHEHAASDASTNDNAENDNNINCNNNNNSNNAGRDSGASAGLDFNVDLDFIRQYIARAKDFNPTIPAHLGDMLANVYVSLRKRKLGNTNRSSDSPRTLLALIRLACAHAKLRFSNVVEERDVNVAVMLHRQSKASLENTSAERHGGKKAAAIDTIHRIIMESFVIASTSMLSLENIEAVVQPYGFSSTQIHSVINKYSELNVWALDESRQSLRLSH